MKNKGIGFIMFIAMLIIGLIVFQLADADDVRATEEARVEQVGVVKDVEIPIEILPSVEFMSGVLSQTSWMETFGPEGLGNEYYQELHEFFSDYKDSEAVVMAEKLVRSGFVYEKPVDYILRMSPFPECKQEAPYNEDLVMCVGGDEILDEFREALIELENESKFYEAFYLQHSEDYNEIIENVLSDAKLEEISKFATEFYGEPDKEFRIVIAPAMFPNGGYGFEIEKDSGCKIAYTIIRSDSRVEGSPEFTSHMDSVVLHELGHSFVDVIDDEEQMKLVNEYKLFRLYRPVEKEMRKQAYNNQFLFLNEQIIRATTAIGVKEILGEEAYLDEVEYQKSRGFYLTEFTIELIDEYEQNRSEYESFNEFIPYMLRQYEENMDELISEQRQG